MKLFSKMPFKRFFDRLFGVHSFMDHKHTWFNFLASTFVVMCFFMYIDHMGEDCELKYGSLAFLFLCIDNLSLFWYSGRNQWQEASRFQSIIMETTHIIFLLIIPLISVNQYYKSDLGCYYLGLVLLLPMLYLIPILRNKLGRYNLYVLILKTSIFFNLLVSIRTTFFGVCCAITILISWSMKNRPNKILHFGFRFVSAYLMYLTLVNVPIPICEMPCEDIIKSDCNPMCNSYNNYRT